MNNTHAELLHAGFTNIYRVGEKADEFPKLLKKMKEKHD